MKINNDIYLNGKHYLDELIAALKDFRDKKYGDVFGKTIRSQNTYPDVTILEKRNGVVAAYFEYDIVKDNLTDADDNFQDMLDMIDEQ